MIAKVNKMKIFKALIAIIVSAYILSCSSDHGAEAVAAKRTRAQLGFLCANLDQYKIDNSSNSFIVEKTDKDYQKKQKSLTDSWQRQVLPIVKNGLVIGVKSLGPNGIDENGDADDLTCSK
jgi:hypothetical protein